MSQYPAQDLPSQIRSRNRCLERLICVSEGFANTPVDSLLPVEDEPRDSLKDYEQSRASILRAIELYDRKIQESIQALASQELNPSLAEELRRLHEEERHLIDRVIRSDEKASAKIREAQTRIQKLVSDGRKARENLKKFKSSWMADSGEEVDTKL